MTDSAGDRKKNRAFESVTDDATAVRSLDRRLHVRVRLSGLSRNDVRH